MTPTPPAPATSTTYAPSPLDVIAHVETGDRNIPQAIHDRNTDRGTPAQGNFQFITPTWQRQAPKAGVDIKQYPTAMSAPPSVQAQVAAVTPSREWGPNTVAAVKARFPGIDVNQPPTGVYHGANVGGAVPTTPGTTLNTPPPATSIANALTGGTGANGQGLSPIQQMQKDVSGEGGQALQPAARAAARNAEHAQPAGRGPGAATDGGAAHGRRATLELGLAAIRLDGRPARRGAPTTLGYFGGQAVPMPGTTLNSIGGAYA